FALWKGAKPGEPHWRSPWGPGRPGWHIECSAMSMKLLGTTLDVHGGGLDLQFPHHENELAQSESYNGTTFVRYWMHNGLMKTGDRKMSKSEGNEIVVTELLKRHAPETLRFLLLSSHYRSPIEYSEDRLHELRRSLEGFHRFFERYERVTGKSFFALKAPARADEHDAVMREFGSSTAGEGARAEFQAAMDDDFNTGAAVATLFNLLTELNRLADTNRLEDPATPKTGAAFVDFQRGTLVLEERSQILGLFQEAPQAKGGGDDRVVNCLMQLLIDLRAEARKGKNFALADQIRKRLGELGITLEDRPGGTGWRLR